MTSSRPSARQTQRPQGTPRLSAEIFTIPFDDRRFIVYAPLRQSAFIGNEYVADCVRRAQSVNWRPTRVDSALVKLMRGLEMIDAAAPEARPGRILDDDPKPSSVALFLTTACNLRCSYCYASAGLRRPRFMSLSTAQRGIDFAAAHAALTPRRIVGVSYHGGGEPTAHWAVLTASADYARAKARALGLSVEITLTTNGILSRDQREWVKAHVTSLTISCDGLPAAHDACRRGPKGEPSSERVFETLTYFDANGVKYGIRATLTADTCRFLAESIDFLSSRFRPDSIQAEPVYLLGRASAAGSAESEEFVQSFRRARERAASNGRRLWFSGARLGTLTNHFCGATQENFCLSADGNVSSCYEAFAEDMPNAELFFYGRPASDGLGYDFDQDALKRLRSQAVENRAYCRDCFARWTCGGDCYYKWRNSSASSTFDGSARCHIIRELTKDQIIEKISETGGTFWREGKPTTGDMTG